MALRIFAVAVAMLALFAASAHAQDDADDQCKDSWIGGSE